MAEVLITLAIIGIVAAMTLPALIQNNRNREFRARLKTAYSLLSQANEHIYTDTGIPVNKENYPIHTLKNTLMKYFKVIKDCGYGARDADKACIANNNHITGTPRIQPYKTYNNLAQINVSLFDDGQFIISNGMLFMIENNNSDIFITVDLNGQDKNPNRWGQDLFTFQFLDNGKLLPMGADGTKYRDMNIYCSANSTSTFNGIACTYKALTEKDYFHKLHK